MTDRTEYFKTYYQKNKAKKDAAHAEYIKKHPEKIAVYNKNYRDKQKPDVRILTKEEIQMLLRTEDIIAQNDG